MTDNSGGMRCQLGCWGTGAIAGLVVAIIMMVVGDVSVTGSIFVGLLVAVVLGVFLSWLLCRPLPTLEEVKARGPVSAPSPTVSGVNAEGTSAQASSQAGAAAATSKATTGSDMEADASGSEQVAAPAGDVETSSEVPPIGAVAAAEERAENIGSDDSAPAPIGAAAAADQAASAAATAEDAEAPAADAPKAAQDTPNATEPADQDYDGDGVVEGTDEGSKPTMLDGPRDGKADNLKEIKGVGPKLEKTLNTMGVYHFDQIATWGDQELAWVDANLEGFKGRASRDEWVPQAKILASGAETEFSKRVEDGGVY